MGKFKARGAYVVVGRRGEIGRASTLADAKEIARGDGCTQWRGPSDDGGAPYYSAKNGDLDTIYVLTPEHPTVVWKYGVPPIVLG